MVSRGRDCGPPSPASPFACGFTPCEPWLVPSFLPCCLSRAEGGKGEFRGEEHVADPKAPP